MHVMNQVSKLFHCALSNPKVTLCWTSPDTPYHSDRNNISTVIYPWYYIMCWHTAGGVQHYYFLYFSIVWVSFSCVHVFTATVWFCVSTHTKGLCQRASSPHLLTCHHVCSVDVTTAPASLLSLSYPPPRSTTVRTPHPVDSQTWTHPIHRLTSNQVKPSAYGNFTQHCLLNMVNCHLSKTTNKQHWRAPLSAHLRLDKLRPKCRYEYLTNTFG